MKEYRNTKCYKKVQKIEFCHQKYGMSKKLENLNFVQKRKLKN